MRDIAKAVGTSAVTVSKALAGKSGMSEKLRSKILKKADEMGYEYPRGNRLVLREHLEIGILIPDRYFEPDSFYAILCKQLIKKLADMGHFGLLEMLSPENERQLTLPNLMTSGHADGLILLGEPSKAYYRKIAQAGVPIVFLDFYDEQANADAVASDNSYGAYRLTSHLIRRGHILLPSYDYGFIGGAAGRLADREGTSGTIVFNGNVAAHPDFRAMESFILHHDYSLKYFRSYPLTDIGGVIIESL